MNQVKVASELLAKRAPDLLLVEVSALGNGIKITTQHGLVICEQTFDRLLN